jgi:site-specific DNA-methyltransferase (cytosine-N4-specific)
MTYLSSLHPYPAMIANDLAIELARRYVTAGDVVLDPFCGTGRTLLAAEAAGASVVVGLDVNPLATMIASAKFAVVSTERMVDFVSRRPTVAKRSLNFETRKVSWFAKRAKVELTSIIEAVNSTGQLSSEDRLLIAAALSSTARHVSFCRNDRWKLHRVSMATRRRTVDTFAYFRRRIEVAVSEIERRGGAKRASARFLNVNCCQLASGLAHHDVPSSFDVVMTSPPYGDSISTVQYGGISSICLDVIQHLAGIVLEHRTGRAIDLDCLGGHQANTRDVEDIRRFWAGGRENAQRSRVLSFLEDMETACAQISEVVKPGGLAIFVVGRRITGGFRLKLDAFVAEAMGSRGFRLESAWRRPIGSKRLPSVINSRGHAMSGSSRVPTMKSEYIVVLRRAE